MTKLQSTALALVLMLAWLGLVFFGAFRGWWMSAEVPEGDLAGFYAQAVHTLGANSQGAAALVLIEDGAVAHSHYTSSSTPIDAQTVFPAASMSKWIAASAIMQLIEAGRADLDTPVSGYLTRWQLPDSEFDNEAVTIRRLLSHTAGFGDGLGFGDYAADERLPTLEEELANPRASSGEPTAIAVAAEPGTEWRYSGGSYLLLELLVEEISGERYAQYVQRAIFEPLNMRRAGYELLDSYENNAGLRSADGTRIASPRYASSAATGLAISSEDLTRFVLAQVNAQPDNPLLNPGTLRDMRTPHGRTFGADIWGLGTILYAPTRKGDFVFGHDGANDPAVNTAARINPDTGDAIIVLSSGHPSVATQIGSAWVLWQTGVPDVLATDAVLSSMLVPAVTGCVLILVLVGLLRVRKRRGAGA